MMPFFKRLFMNEAKILMMLCVAIVLVLATGCTQMEFYAGMRRMDTIKTETTASDGNFLCGVMGYCREGESKRQ